MMLRRNFVGSIFSAIIATLGFKPRSKPFSAIEEPEVYDLIFQNRGYKDYGNGVVKVVVFNKRFTTGERLNDNESIVDRTEWYLNDKIHREDGPAVEFSTGEKHWYREGWLHREDGPAIEFTDGSEEWYQNGHLHREDGPASINRWRQIWYFKGNLHRLDGPALVEYNGAKRWFANGTCHRMVAANGKLTWESDFAKETWKSYT
jgi:hypothetical protein